MFAIATGIDIVGSVSFSGSTKMEPIRNATAMVSPRARPRAKMIEPIIPVREYGKIMSLITFPGSLFLAAISVLPAVIVALMNIQQGWALFYGGTSLLIMVGVAIDTIQQINAYLLNRHYDGLMKSGKTRRVA